MYLKNHHDGDLLPCLADTSAFTSLAEYGEELTTAHDDYSIVHREHYAAVNHHYYLVEGWLKQASSSNLKKENEIIFRFFKRSFEIKGTV